MIRNCYGVLVWLVLAVLLYGAADLVAKGQDLNRITPIPIFGYVLWAIVLLFLWRFLVKPIFDFLRLSRLSRRSPKDRAIAMCRRLRSRFERNTGGSNATFEKGRIAYARLDEAIKRKRWDLVDGLVKECLPYDTLHEGDRALILKYSRAAALAVAFSRNSTLDGVCMLVIQMRLVIALARLYGYKPSPVFNLCCFAWIAVNSVISTLLGATSESIAESAFSGMGEGGADEAFGDALGEVAIGGVDDGALLGAEAVGQRIASFTVGILLEAIMAGAAVYVTGRIFSAKLNGEWEKPTFSSLIKLRREGRKELGKGIPGMMKSLVSNVGTLGKETIVSSYKYLHGVIFSAESHGEGAPVVGAGETLAD